MKQIKQNLDLILVVVFTMSIIGITYKTLSDIQQVDVKAQVKSIVYNQYK